VPAFFLWVEKTVKGTKSGSGRTGSSCMKRKYMNLIYNSEQYSVVEFGADHGQEALRFGGYEIMDKSVQREIFIGGSWAESFRQSVKGLIDSESSIEVVDDFLGGYDALMRHPLIFH
jgi:hypothetical protein